ncbi:MAG TPA: CBS domain-containing protein [Aminobacterium sp.]|uniref:CBS domain-containing protein n=1 Tax=Aminobacterium TaxID=81466 RepID=UPI000463B422|nr:MULTISPECIES: CBS domain-containing protein [Aminobacterium]HCA41484.1 CBS domain-containing protein [Aminobacterium sp.]
MNTFARELMHKDLAAVMEEDSILDVVRILYSHNISGIPVVREDWELIGYISETDILKAAVPTYLEVLAQSSFLDNGEIRLVDRFKNLGKKTVKDFMTKSPVFVDSSASLMTVADLMLRKKIKRLPVVENNKLIGIINRDAFCEFVMEEHESDESE